MKRWDGRHLLTVVGAGAFSIFTKSKSTRPLLILEINYLHIADPLTSNNSNTFQEIRCKTSRYKNSFFPDATSLWNNIISNFQEIPTFAGLKSHLLSLIRPKIKSTFGIHDALGLRYLFQLRVNLSPLRSHKRRHNFSDTPSETCECNLGIEDNRHFECPFYAIQRVTLAVNVIDILQRKNLNHLGNHPELYLYGHPSFDLIDNRQIYYQQLNM